MRNIRCVCGTVGPFGIREYRQVHWMPGNSGAKCWCPVIFDENSTIQNIHISSKEIHIKFF